MYADGLRVSLHETSSHGYCQPREEVDAGVSPPPMRSSRRLSIGRMSCSPHSFRNPNFKYLLLRPIVTMNSRGSAAHRQESITAA